MCHDELRAVSWRRPKYFVYRSEGLTFNPDVSERSRIYPMEKLTLWDLGGEFDIYSKH